MSEEIKKELEGTALDDNDLENVTGGATAVQDHILISKYDETQIEEPIPLYPDPLIKKK